MSEREASTVLLLRGEGADLEVYLVERAPQLRFFGGYHALPGGVLDQADGSSREDRDAALRQCAVRELFEETGVLLGGGTPSAAARQRLLGGDGEPWRSSTDVAAAAAELQPLCRIRTPPFAPVRYDTEFYAARLPVGQTPEIWAGELVGGAFWRPAEALAAWRRGAVEIVPPVLILLELLVDRDLAAFAQAAADIAESYRQGALHRVRFSPGIIMASLATETLPPATTTNCLIVGEERMVAIDPATRDAREQQRLFALLDELIAEGRTFDAVVLTHHHPDHVGAAHAVSTRYSVPVRAHELTLSRLPEIERAGEPIGDGDRIALGTAPDGSEDWQLEAVFTPGHDRGHLCFRDSRYGALIAGDMISTVSTIIIDPPEGHLATYLASLERLQGLQLGTLYPAHGPAVREGGKIVEHFVRHRRKRQSKLTAALREAPATIIELLPKVYDDTHEKMWPYAARSLLAGLQMLEEQGEARVDGDRWTWTGEA